MSRGLHISRRRKLQSCYSFRLLACSTRAFDALVQFVAALAKGEVAVSFKSMYAAETLLGRVFMDRSEVSSLPFCLTRVVVRRVTHSASEIRTLQNAERLREATQA